MKPLITTFTTGTIVLAALFIAGIASAELVQGRIIEVSPNANYLKVSRLDPQSGKTEELKMSVKQDTEFEGIQSLDDLEAGEEVAIEAEQRGLTRQWQAMSIRSAE